MARGNKQSFSMDKNNSLELRLDKILKGLKLEEPISVDDIKNMIWNETDHMDLARLFQFLTEEETDPKKIEEVMEILQEAWNNLPHKTLKGLSPEEKIQHKTPPKNITAPKIAKKVHDLFPGRYPEKVRFTKIGDIEWGFEFPGYYYNLVERLFQLEELNLSAEEYEEELRAILRICPEAFDAAKELAEFYILNDELILAQEILEKTIKIARSYIPKTFIPGKHLIIWGYLDNRPFLRLLTCYADLVEQIEGLEQAILLYEELLIFNPNDNQGIRELLSTAYFKMNRLDKVLKLNAQYPDDTLPAIYFGGILALLKLGKLKEAEKQLKKMGKYRINIINELLKEKHPKPKNLMPDRVAVGGEDEAYYYWRDQGKFWEETEGAKEFLQKYYNQLKKRS